MLRAFVFCCVVVCCVLRVCVRPRACLLCVVCVRCVSVVVCVVYCVCCCLCFVFRVSLSLIVTPDFPSCKNEPGGAVNLRGEAIPI